MIIIYDREEDAAAWNALQQRPLTWAKLSIMDMADCIIEVYKNSYRFVKFDIDIFPAFANPDMKNNWFPIDELPDELMLQVTEFLKLRDDV